LFWIVVNLNVFFASIVDFINMFIVMMFSVTVG